MEKKKEKSDVGKRERGRKGGHPKGQVRVKRKGK